MRSCNSARCFLVLAAALYAATNLAAADGGEPQAVVKFRRDAARVFITIGDQPLATYVFADEKISRPYFAHVHAGGGPQLTRNHPPLPEDAQDHDLLHPGIWLAFGDLSGHDSWRLKAPVKGGVFLVEPSADESEGGFTVRNSYLAADGKTTVCTEDCRYRFIPRPWGCLLIADSEFHAEIDLLTFGDQMEEMGLGIRLATPLAVKSGLGGQIRDSAGHLNEREVRETLSDWCDYFGTVEGRQCGITLMGAPGNPRRIWWHARDYGFVAANPFHSHPDRQPNVAIVLNRSDSVRFTFGIALHSAASNDRYDPAAAWQDFLSMCGEAKQGTSKKQ